MQEDEDAEVTRMSPAEPIHSYPPHPADSLPRKRSSSLGTIGCLAGQCGIQASNSTDQHLLKLRSQNFIMFIGFIGYEKVANSLQE